jgi:hypothetical protein
MKLFRSSKAFRKNKADSETPVEALKDLWIQHSIYTTRPFPTFLRRLEVISKKEVITGPLENACHIVSSKNTELLDTIERFSSSASAASVPASGPSLTSSTGVNISPLAMALKGVIDASVNGGPELYQQAFFSSALSVSDTSKVLVTKLKDLLKRQVEILGS